MRQLKFRVWNGETMISPDYIARDGRAHWKENSIPNASSEIMQFTGIQDCEGGDLYEYDIIKFNTSGYVVFNVVGFHGTGFYCKDSNECLHMPRVFEIVGNIYQNPELLQS